MLALALAACGEETRQSTAPTRDPVPSALTIHDTLIDCAGALAAEGNVDPLVEPSIGTREENALWTVLALMDKAPGFSARPAVKRRHAQRPSGRRRPVRREGRAPPNACSDSAVSA